MKIKLVLTQISLQQNVYDPCLFTGHIHDPFNPAYSPSSSPLTLGLYVNYFVYFSVDPEVEEKFQRILKELITQDFMGKVEWFLGMHFQWMITPDSVQVLLRQTRFAAILVEENNIQNRSITHVATPHCSGLPIDTIPESNED
jgi:hypothetical protein